MNIGHHRAMGCITQSAVDLGPEMYRLTYRTIADDEFFITSRGVVPYEALTEFQKGVFDAMRLDAVEKRE